MRWSPYTVDPKTGRQCLGSSKDLSGARGCGWYPAEEDTGVAAVATALANQADGDLEDMKRRLARAFRGLWS